MNLDVTPTVLAAAGHPIAAAAQLDGVDLVPFLTGKANGYPHEKMSWRGGDQWAVRDGDWKLVVSKGGSGVPELYDLASDIGEQRNLAAAEPDRVNALQKLYDGWNVRQSDPIDRDDQPRRRQQRKKAARAAAVDDT